MYHIVFLLFCIYICTQCNTLTNIICYLETNKIWISRNTKHISNPCIRCNSSDLVYMFWLWVNLFMSEFSYEWIYFNYKWNLYVLIVSEFVDKILMNNDSCLQRCVWILIVLSPWRDCSGTVQILCNHFRVFFSPTLSLHSIFSSFLLGPYIIIHITMSWPNFLSSHSDLDDDIESQKKWKQEKV